MSDSAVPAVLTFADLAPRHAVWVERNFPGGSPDDCLHGVNEELGELADAMVASGLDARASALDAIGDISIYLVDFVRRVGPMLDAPPSALACDVVARSTIDHQDDGVHEIVRYNRYFGLVRLTSSIGRLNHAYLKCKQGIRGTKVEREEKIATAIVDVLRSLHRLSAYFETTLEEIIARTWTIVGARDWVANPTTGVARTE